MANEIYGDLLTLNLGKDDFIIHQTNCRTSYAMGLAKALFDKFPNANVYQKRYEDQRIPGTYLVTDNIGLWKRVALFGQDSPGKWKTVAARDQREQCISEVIKNLVEDIT